MFVFVTVWYTGVGFTTVLYTVETTGGCVTTFVMVWAGGAGWVRVMVLVRVTVWYTGTGWIMVE